MILPTSTQATTVYSKFNAAWPGWPQLSFTSQDSFPWTIVSYAGYLMGDTKNVETYIDNIQSQYVNVTPSFPWPFYDAEGGWFLRTNTGMKGGQ